MLSCFSIDKYPGEKHIPIILWGAGKIGSQLVAMYELQYMDYNIVAIVDSDKTKQNKDIVPTVAKNMNKDNAYFKRNIPVIAPEQMVQYCNNNSECVIVIATIDEYKDEIYKQITNLNVKNTIMGWVEFSYLVIREYIDCRIKKYNPELAYQYHLCYYNSVNHNFVNKFRPIVAALDKKIPFVTIVSPPKTGGNTIDDALTEKGIPHLYYHNGHNLNENPEKPNKWVPIINKVCKKFIIGVREPISQNISLMFNDLSGYFSLLSHVNNLDAQQLFDKYVMEPVLGKASGSSFYEREMMETGTNFIGELFVQNYFEQSIKTTLDIDVYKIEFNKEKGYAIAEQNGKKIFIYQVERLGSLNREMADFLELESIDLGRSNDSTNKSYNYSYRKFLNKVKLSEEYWHYSYSCDFIKHFYSKEDIHRYMTKWSEHVEK